MSFFYSKLCLNFLQSVNIWTFDTASCHVSSSLNSFTIISQQKKIWTAVTMSHFKVSHCDTVHMYLQLCECGSVLWDFEMPLQLVEWHGVSAPHIWTATVCMSLFLSGLNCSHQLHYTSIFSASYHKTFESPENMLHSSIFYIWFNFIGLVDNV